MQPPLRAFAIVILALLLTQSAAADDRPLALVALIDNDSGDTLTGDIAEVAGGLVTGSLTLTGRYDQSRLLVGRRATRDNFFAALHELIRKDYVIDIILETHGNPERLAVHGGRLTGKDIVDQLYLKGGEKIRLVYMMGCYSASLVDDWVRVGADAVTGHVGLNVVPVFHFPAFLRAWASGADAKTATERAYAASRRQARAGWYKRVSRLFSPVRIKDEDIEEGSVPVFAGKKITIRDIPDPAEERAWVEARREDEEFLGKLDRVLSDNLGVIDGESLREWRGAGGSR